MGCRGHLDTTVIAVSMAAVGIATVTRDLFVTFESSWARRENRRAGRLRGLGWGGEGEREWIERPWETREAEVLPSGPCAQYTLFGLVRSQSLRCLFRTPYISIWRLNSSTPFFCQDAGGTTTLSSSAANI